MKLYNTRTRKKEEFKPIKEGKVGIYSCGPTVYWNQHIGHMYAYIQWDVMVRFFRALDFDVSWVMNITDVGHLTSDADTGEDKMEKGAKREGLTVWQIAERYIDQFMESVTLVNIQKPDVMCRATEQIEDQINLIKKIEGRGFAYKTKTGLVFDTTKFADYTKFANLDLAKQRAGARVKVDEEKKQPEDFLLWVTNQPEHIMQWESPWGKGFPGWHIECTAMSTKYLGEKFDIHTGGMEHIPVHHTNEIAQGFGAYGTHTANYWLHNAMLNLKGEKMSKSKGNFYTARELVEKGYNPMHFRYLVLTSNYRSGLNFSWESLDSAKAAYDKLLNLINGWRVTSRSNLSEGKVEKIDKFRDGFIKALSDDLNYPQALAVLWEAAKSNIPNQDKLDLILDFDRVFGLRLNEVSNVRYQVSDVIQKLIEKREELRKQGRYEEADEVRKQIEGMGFSVEDSDSGPKLKKI